MKSIKVLCNELIANVVQYLPALHATSTISSGNNLSTARVPEMQNTIEYLRSLLKLYIKHVDNGNSSLAIYKEPVNKI